MLADEIHTPDSSRYWLADSYPSALPQGRRRRRSTRISCGAGWPRAAIPTPIRFRTFRPTIILQAAATYIEVYEKLTGREFALPDLSVPPLARVRANLRKYFERAA